MNIFKKLMNGVNPDDEEPFNDVFSDDELYDGSDGSFGNVGDISDFMSGGGGGGYSPYGNPNQGGGMTQPQQPSYQQVQNPAHTGNSGGLTVTAGSSMQFSAEVKLVKPEDYDNVNQIADHVINRRTVILNLEETNKETARRLLDFLNGVAYAIQGQVKRVSDKTFVIAPNNIVISSEQIKEESRRNNNNTDNSIY